MKHNTDNEFSRVEIADGIRNIWYWQQGAMSFHSGLFSLIAKADSRNREKIKMGYPLHIAVYNIWDKAKDVDALFEEYGLEPVSKMEKKGL